MLIDFVLEPASAWRPRSRQCSASARNQAQPTTTAPSSPALRRGTTESLNQTGEQVVRRNLNIQPTMTIRPGFPVRVIVNRDLALTPYQD
jgi:type IV secretory pathway VirB10-like protein